jgi:hypothetical protein
VNAKETKPIALGSALTAFCSSPLELSALALGEIFRLSPRKMFWNASCVPEAPSRSNRSIGPENLAPVADRPRENALDQLLGEVRDGVLRVGDHADPVLGDLGEREPVGVRAEGVARGVADVEAPAGDAADPDVRLAAPDFGFGDPRVCVVVGGGEFLSEGQHGG